MAGRVRRWRAPALLGEDRGQQGHGARLTQQLWLLVGQDLVEDVVVPLRLELADHSGLL